MLLPGKTVIITGVGPGMGREMALIAAREGARVAMVARTRARLDDVAGEIADAGGSAIGVVADVSDPMQCQRVAGATVEAFGRIDGLVNSALSAVPTGPIEGADLAQWLGNMQVTCIGALQMVQAVLPAMRDGGGGAIVNISSKATIQPAPGQAAYAVSKAALEGATRQLAAELGPFGIRVNCVRPGWLWGPAVEAHLEHRASEEQIGMDELKATIAANIPLGLIPPDEECAKAVLMLLSDYARVVTGVALDVNGGELMLP